MRCLLLARARPRKILQVALLLSLALARSNAATNYAISLANPEQHLVEVQITLPEGSSQRELQLPVWNAIYQVRDFAQYINWVRAKEPAKGNDHAGRALPVRALDKSRWLIIGAESGAVVDYQISVDSPGPFGAQFNSHRRPMADSPRRTTIVSSILPSRSATSKNLISRKRAATIASSSTPNLPTTTWKQSLPCCGKSFPLPPVGWMIVPSTATCFSIISRRDRLAAAWSTLIQLRFL
jgi:hypothetical protein